MLLNTSRRSGTYAERILGYIIFRKTSIMSSGGGGFAASFDSSEERPSVRVAGTKSIKSVLGVPRNSEAHYIYVENLLVCVVCL